MIWPGNCLMGCNQDFGSEHTGSNKELETVRLRDGLMVAESEGYSLALGIFVH